MDHTSLAILIIGFIATIAVIVGLSSLRCCRSRGTRDSASDGSALSVAGTGGEPGAGTGPHHGHDSGSHSHGDSGGGGFDGGHGGH